MERTISKEEEAAICDLIVRLGTQVSGLSRLAVALALIRATSYECQEPDWKAAHGMAMAKFYADYGTKAPDDPPQAAALWEGGGQIEEALAFVQFLRDKGRRIDPLLAAMREKARESA